MTIKDDHCKILPHFVKNILLLKIAIVGLSKKTKSVQTCWRKIATLRIPPLCTMSFKVSLVLQLDFLQKSLCILFARKSTTCSFGEFIALTKITLMIARKDKEHFCFESIVAKKCTMSRQQYVAKCKKWLKQKWLFKNLLFFLQGLTWQNYSFSALIPFRPFRSQ